MLTRDTQIQNPSAETQQRAQTCASATDVPALTVRVTIEYCPLSNYEGVAESLAAAIQEASVEEDCGVKTRLVPSHGGVFEVTVGGKLIFSKRATQRLPEANEILYHVRAAASPKDHAVGANYDGN